MGKPKTCEHPDCKTQAYFNHMGQTRGKYCKKHCEKGMVNVQTNVCHHPGCMTQPYFNHIGQKKGKYCKLHKEEDMVNVVDKTCKREGCRLIPVFGFEGKRPECCESHKEEGMVNVKASRCHHPECKRKPLFNSKDQTSGKYCSFHKNEDMVNLVADTCEHPGCYTIANFNIEGTKTGRFCSFHKEPGMVDIRSRYCEHPGCKIHPYYNHLGQTRARFCVGHKEPKMVNVLQKCVIPHCGTKGNKKFDGYCFHCFIITFPDDPVSRNFRIQEKEVTQFVQKSFPKHEWILDKTISGGCSARRPDMLLEFKTYCIIVEIDENQHKRYDLSHEEERTEELVNDIKKNVVLIRFNPDGYKGRDGTVPTPWVTRKTGISLVKTRLKEWESRLTQLKDTIERAIKNVPEKRVEIIKLFYDEK